MLENSKCYGKENRRTVRWGGGCAQFVSLNRPAQVGLAERGPLSKDLEAREFEP